MAQPGRDGVTQRLVNAHIPLSLIATCRRDSPLNEKMLTAFSGAQEKRGGGNTKKEHEKKRN